MTFESPTMTLKVQTNEPLQQGNLATFDTFEATVDRPRFDASIVWSATDKGTDGILTVAIQDVEPSIVEGWELNQGIVILEAGYEDSDKGRFQPKRVFWGYMKRPVPFTEDGVIGYEITASTKPPQMKKKTVPFPTPGFEGEVNARQAIEAQLTAVGARLVDNEWASAVEGITLRDYASFQSVAKELENIGRVVNDQVKPTLVLTPDMGGIREYELVPANPDPATTQTITFIDVERDDAVVNAGVSASEGEPSDLQFYDMQEGVLFDVNGSQVAEDETFTILEMNVTTPFDPRLRIGKLVKFDRFPIPGVRFPLFTTLSITHTLGGEDVDSWTTEYNGPWLGGNWNPGGR